MHLTVDQFFTLLTELIGVLFIGVLLTIFIYEYETFRSKK